MKPRRHHNNHGLRQIKRGRTAQQMKRLAQKLGVQFCVGKAENAAPARQTPAEGRL